jgi:hypothetical protein
VPYEPPRTAQLAPGEEAPLSRAVFVLQAEGCLGIAELLEGIGGEMENLANE